MPGLGGLLLGRELDCAHSCAPSSLWDTAALAGSAVGRGRLPGVSVQAHPSIPGPAAIKSAATALPLSWEGVWEPPQHPVCASAQPTPVLCPCPALCTPAQRELAFQTKLGLCYSWSLATAIADFTIILQRTQRNIKLLV